MSCEYHYCSNCDRSFHDDCISFEGKTVAELEGQIARLKAESERQAKELSNTIKSHQKRNAELEQAYDEIERQAQLIAECAKVLGCFAHHSDYPGATEMFRRLTSPAPEQPREEKP